MLCWWQTGVTVRTVFYDTKTSIIENITHRISDLCMVFLNICMEQYEYKMLFVYLSIYTYIFSVTYMRLNEYNASIRKTEIFFYLSFSFFSSSSFICYLICLYIRLIMFMIFHIYKRRIDGKKVGIIYKQTNKYKAIHNIDTKLAWGGIEPTCLLLLPN